VSRTNRLEDKIRNLSEKLLEAEGEEFHRLASELRTALTEHIERIRARMLLYPLGAHEKRKPKP
jgi:hypothetical protein